MSLVDRPTLFGFLRLRRSDAAYTGWISGTTSRWDDSCYGEPCSYVLEKGIGARTNRIGTVEMIALAGRRNRGIVVRDLGFVPDRFTVEPKATVVSLTAISTISHAIRSPIDLLRIRDESKTKPYVTGRGDEPDRRKILR